MELTEEQRAELEKEKQNAVAKAIAEKELELKKKHDSEMADQRIKAKAEKEDAIKKAEENAKLSADEKAKKEFEEQRKKEQEELEQLRFEKKLNERKEKLVKAGVPEVFKNDSRLVNAKDEDVESVIKTIASDWKGLLPSGATITTNVVGGNTPPSDEFSQFRNLGIKK